MRFQFSALNGKLLNSFLQFQFFFFFLSLFILFYYVRVCVGGVCISTFVRFPHSHFAFLIQCYSFNGIAKAELG